MPNITPILQVRYYSSDTLLWNPWRKVLTADDLGDFPLGNPNYPLLGYGSKLLFFGADWNCDMLWIARHNTSLGHSDLRVNIGAGSGEDDRLVVGTSQFYGDNFIPRFVVTNSGRVGINVEHPQHSLEVNGVIRAKEIKVETNWADFVFADDYRLPSLNEVKQHIAENSRLPGLPSEAEVKENGVNLGEMQVKLLQKIEELTLYVIQQQEEINVLKNKVRQLKEK